MTQNQSVPWTSKMQRLFFSRGKPNSQTNRQNPQQMPPPKEKLDEADAPLLTPTKTKKFAQGWRPLPVPSESIGHPLKWRIEGIRFNEPNAPLFGFVWCTGLNQFLRGIFSTN